MSSGPKHQQADSHENSRPPGMVDVSTLDEKIKRLLVGMPKLLASGKVLFISFAAVLAMGLLWIFSPVIDGASEIFLPGSTSYVIEFLGVAALVMLFHITCFVTAAVYRRSVRYLIYMLVPAVLIVAADRILRPADLTWTDRRVASFQLGAQYRVDWAGGPAKVRQESLALLAKTAYVSVPKSEWPESIRALRGSSVKINKSARLVDVEIPRRRCFFWGDQFGYLITDANAPEPVIVNDPPVIRGHNLWRIADGIYLYETWP